MLKELPIKQRTKLAGTNVILPMINKLIPPMAAKLRSACVILICCLATTGFSSPREIIPPRGNGSKPRSAYTIVPSDDFAKTTGSKTGGSRLHPDAASVDDDAEVPDKTKKAEILGLDQTDIRLRRFAELVVLPLGVCLALIMLLRRGLLR